MLMSLRAFRLATLFSLMTPMLDAGELNPPGAPAPTQRVPISASTTPGTATAEFRITAPGSYYLTGNVAGSANKSGIAIQSDNVTLDLNGFLVEGVPDSQYGIVAFDMGGPEYHNITIFNGGIRNWGLNGIFLFAQNARVEGVTVSGCQFWGIAVEGSGPTGAVVTRCNALDNGLALGNVEGGIQVNHGSTVTECSAVRNQGIGIRAESSVVSQCAADDNVRGIEARSDSVVSNCVINDSTETGLLLQSSRGEGNTVNDNATGINAQSAHVLNNLVQRNSTVGIVSNGSRIEGNLVQGVSGPNSAVGIRSNSSSNICLVIRNSCSQNGGGNYDILGTSAFGPLVDVTPGGAIASEHPWANFSF